jgi:hypothetical protein
VLRRRVWLIAALTLMTVVLGLVVRNQVKVYRGRQARSVDERQRSFDQSQRRILYDLLQPVALSNCVSARPTTAAT